MLTKWFKRSPKFWWILKKKFCEKVHVHFYSGGYDIVKYHRFHVNLHNEIHCKLRFCHLVAVSVSPQFDTYLVLFIDRRTEVTRLRPITLGTVSQVVPIVR